MNKKSKLNKLKLTSNKRENKQISNFLSNTNSNQTQETNNSLNQSSIETKAKRLLKETETILLLSDDEDDRDGNKTRVANSLEGQKIENSENNKNERETVVSKFFNESLNDFEISATKNTREKLTLKEKIIKRKGKNTKKKKQTTIKSAFTRNEEIFSNLMAQHSIAENFNPEEMQIALACSISETEYNSRNSIEFKDPVICSSENSNKIREKLQQYGFKTNSNSEDYNINYFLPKGKRKAKWANKFTSLTLRCPEKQKRKLEENIENFLKTQFVESHDCNESPFQFKLTSPLLKTLVPEFDTIKFFRKSLYMDIESDDNEIFYVTDLFEPTKSKPGSLLRNFKDIPGRDLSPERPSTKNNTLNEYVDNTQIYEEKFFTEQPYEKDDRPFKKPLNSNFKELNSMEISDNTPNTNFSLNLNNSIFSPEIENYCIKSKESLFSPECKKAKIDSVLYEKETLEMECNRCESPDIFALSDEELCATETCHYNTSPSKTFKIFLNQSHIEKKNNNNLQNNLNESITENEDIEDENIIIYEKFSSDEVKVFDEKDSSNSLIFNKTNISTDMGKVIDLTQSEESISDYENNEKFSADHSLKDILSENNSNDNIEHNDFGCCDESFKNYETTNNSILIDDEILKSPLQLSIKETNLSPSKSFLKESVENSVLVYDLTQNEICEQDLSKNNSILIDDEIVNPPLQLSIKETNLSPSKSFLKESVEKSSLNSILVYDLTQNEICEQDLSKNSRTSNLNEFSLTSSNNLDDSCIILSDDEVNYSIINSTKKNCKFKRSLEDSNAIKENSPKVKELEVSFIDFIEKRNIIVELKNLQCNESYVEILEDNLNLSQSCSQLTPKKYGSSFENSYFDSLSANKITSNTNEKMKENENEEKDFSIITDIEDETFDLNNLRRKYGLSSTKKNSNTNKRSTCKKSLSESFSKVDTGQSNIQRYSTFTKSNKISDNTTLDGKENHILKTSFEDFDEFDKLIYGSPVKNDQRPNDFEKLLTAEINKFSPIKTSNSIEPFEFSNDGKVYLIKTQNVPLKPDYNRMDSPTRLKELYKLGLKPLKRKQAITMLEYIYNQTHPFILEKINSNENVEVISQNNFTNLDTENNNKAEKNKLSPIKSNQLNLKDCFWEELCDIEEKTTFEAENELYIFQTNISKKISTALLPFHIAWSNLVQSNIHLKEIILHFEPVDLQEIYIFFKSIGYRYDPKDMKKFFDNKCVIFRYDLNNNSGNRHVRKKKTKC